MYKKVAMKFFTATNLYASISILNVILEIWNVDKRSRKARLVLLPQNITKTNE